jgi:FkbM family methyltransferase
MESTARSYVSLGIRNTPHGEVIFLPQDTYLGKSIAHYGQYSEEEALLFARMLRPGMTALDVGANIGYFSLVMSKALGPLGKLYAFEPQALLYRLLCANLAMNGCANATCLLAAAGRRQGRILVPELDYFRELNFGGFSVGRCETGVDAPVMAIDDLPLEACHFIKVDVEGMEQEVLEGAVRTIERFQPVLWVENDREDKAKDLVSFIYSIGYEAYWFINYLYNPKNYANNEVNLFSNTASANLLCKPADQPCKFTAPRCTPDNPGLPVEAA